MRSSKGFTLQPLQAPSASPMPPRSGNMMGLPPKSFQTTGSLHAKLPAAQSYDTDRLAFLEDENSQLKIQLREANELIVRLREENADYKQ